MSRSFDQSGRTGGALPIAPVLGEVRAALEGPGACVLQAPPGAGKTTQVPLALLEARGIRGRILMLEPRRVAARAAAERLAAQLGQRPGGDVGYRMRGESVPGARIEVITEGILTRMIQSDAELSGVGCVIFDEFHERALQADLGLALCLEIRGALRPDLRLLVMSATLDAAPVAALIGDAPVVTSEGKAFPVETRWLERPLGPGTRVGRAFERAAADLVRRAVGETEGDVLVFLPGQGEIGRVGGMLQGLDAEIVPLHGGLPFKAQRKALEPHAEGKRRVVLATSIAETSLTIPGVRVVVDCGRARRARLDPGNGMSRLVTERVTRAEARQRQGRAGRVAEGVCYRLWTQGEEGALAEFPPAEIEIADLVPLALELAMWGAADPAQLPFLTPPNPGAFATARELLTELGALDEGGGLTERGRAMAALPVHPRLARMLLEGGAAAAGLAALVEARDPLIVAGMPPADLGLRLDLLRDPKRRPADAGRLAEIRAEAKRLGKLAGKGRDLSPGALASLAYPDRIALRRPGEQPRYLMSGGTGARLDPADGLAQARLLVAVDLDGARQDARIRGALVVSEAELRELHPVREVHLCRWSRRHRQVEARVQERLGALVLADRVWTDAPDDARLPAFLEGVRDLGLRALNWTAASEALCHRAEWLRGSGVALPDMSEAGLLEELEDWLAPFLAGLRSWGEVTALDLHPALAARLGPAGEQALREGAPSHFTAPTGTRVRIDYSGEAPEAAVRLQELFGLAKHPVAAGRPLRLTLLSPAGRPVQTTQDLPGFWASSYADVRKDMRGRYPKHPWPEDPLSASPTRRTKRAGS